MNYQFDFDLGLSSSRPSSSRPLRDQNPNPNPTTAPKPSPAPSWTPQPPKPSWTHQPAPRSGIANPPTSMAGDIFGKTWAPAAPSSTSRLGIPDKNPNLFGDLLGSALPNSKVNNAPLKAAPPRNSFSMGSLSDPLPKTPAPTPAPSSINNSIKSTSRSAENLNNFSSTSMKSSINTKKDPFESLAGFGSKPSSNPPPNSSSNFSFGDFQKAKVDSFSKPAQGTFSSQSVQEKSGGDPLESLFSSPASAAAATVAKPEVNDWDFGTEFGGNDGSGEMTTELEGLPPPPSGVTASAAKTKGMDNYKQGQFADAIKWLTWSIVLFDKSGDSTATSEVLTCRASCYKEVGEYKKAVADCSKVLEHDSTNIAVLVQRALLYESTEKYRLGTEDLRMVLKIDPGNRLARSTIHRLSKLAD